MRIILFTMLCILYAGASDYRDVANKDLREKKEDTERVEVDRVSISDQTKLSKDVFSTLKDIVHNKNNTEK